MDNYLNLIAKTISDSFQIKEDITLIILQIIFSATTGGALYKLIRWLFKIYSLNKTATDLHPFFTKFEIKHATRFYIPTKCQNVPANKETEPRESNAFVVKSKLIPFFFKQAFRQKSIDNRFYIVLADSGMGKTTFMINLYIRYKSIINFRKHYNILLIPFSNLDVDEKIKRVIELHQETNTILLLDAFDEDIKAAKDYKNRLDEIVALVKDFRIVVITSRTQFFPTQDEEPFELKLRKNYEGGFHVFHKLYVAPFDDKDIKRYLNKKFKLLPSKKKRKAWKIVKKSPNLMVRPMLLNYIDVLLEDNLSFHYSYQIYETLIEKWITREVLRKPIIDREIFKQELYKFSRIFAIELYKNYKATGYQIPRDEILPIAKSHNIDLEEFEITGRSLLTRNAASDWKFAHKSILEYFIAYHLTNNLFKDMNFTSLDQCKKFFKEMCFMKYTNTLNSLNLQGKFIYKNEFSKNSFTVPVKSNNLLELTKKSKLNPSKQSFSIKLSPTMKISEKVTEWLRLHPVADNINEYLYFINLPHSFQDTKIQKFEDVLAVYVNKLNFTTFKALIGLPNLRFIGIGRYDLQLKSFKQKLFEDYSNSMNIEIRKFDNKGLEIEADDFFKLFLDS